MKGESCGLISGISIGLVIGVILAVLALFCFRCHRKRSQIGTRSSRRAATIPIRANGADSCTNLSDSTLAPESPVKSGCNCMFSCLDAFRKSYVVSVAGIPEYSYKYVFRVKPFAGLAFSANFECFNGLKSLCHNRVP